MSNLNAEQRSLYSTAWRGLGAWNFYFLAKLSLYWTGFIGFDIFYNLIFAAFLLMPLRPPALHVLRNICALPIGIALLYYDTWLPPITRIIAQAEVLQFSNQYLLELTLRFINWNLLGAGLVFLVIYLFLSQWLRLTTWTLLALLVVALPRLSGIPSISWDHTRETISQGLNIQSAEPAALAAPGSRNLNDTLNQELERFYQSEKNRTISFSLPVADAASFDVLLLNICSLAWSDLRVSELEQHPLFSKMDIMFDNFNTATSYSGPAVLRLMRASCGQPAHDELYKPTDNQCHLIGNLNALGFADSAVLNHTGEFDGFIDELSLAGFAAPPLIPKSTKPKLRAFDDSPIWGDYDALNLWWADRLIKDEPATVLLYNSISLHDGNREVTADGGSRPAPYSKLAQTLLDDLEAFIAELKASGRQVMVVFVPEHGAALEGDRMQIPGMREIPTPDITHVPVGVRFLGTQSEPPAIQLRVAAPTSYLALSELISRTISRDVFDQPQVDWQSLVTDLPATQAVSENSGTVMMVYEGNPYIRIGSRDWIKYVQ